jgi:hypothetical protein
MLWGVISWRGVGRLHRVEGRMDAKQYTAILEESFLGSLRDKNVKAKNMIFQQDNDSKHRSKLATKWFQDHNIKVLPWPASSPDQSIIEHVWDYLDRQVRKYKVGPSNIDELWGVLQYEWERIPLSYIHKLYESIPRRIEKLHEARGRWTKY